MAERRSIVTKIALKIIDFVLKTGITKNSSEMRKDDIQFPKRLLPAATKFQSKDFLRN